MTQPERDKPSQQGTRGQDEGTSEEPYVRKPDPKAMRTKRTLSVNSLMLAVVGLLTTLGGLAEGSPQRAVLVHHERLAGGRGSGLLNEGLVGDANDGEFCAADGCGWQSHDRQKRSCKASVAHWVGPSTSWAECR